MTEFSLDFLHLFILVFCRQSRSIGVREDDESGREEEKKRGKKKQKTYHQIRNMRSRARGDIFRPSIKAVRGKSKVLRKRKLSGEKTVDFNRHLKSLQFLWCNALLFIAFSFTVCLFFSFILFPLFFLLLFHSHSFFSRIILSLLLHLMQQSSQFLSSLYSLFFSPSVVSIKD